MAVGTEGENGLKVDGPLRRAHGKENSQQRPRLSSPQKRLHQLLPQRSYHRQIQSMSSSLPLKRPLSRPRRLHGRQQCLQRALSELSSRLAPRMCPSPIKASQGQTPHEFQLRHTLWDRILPMGRAILVTSPQLEFMAVVPPVSDPDAQLVARLSTNRIRGKSVPGTVKRKRRGLSQRWWFYQRRYVSA